MSDFSINLNAVSWNATEAVLNLDKGFVGTPDYMGVAYFWNYAYRHYLRDASIAQRRRIHKKMLDCGLAVDGASEIHAQIIFYYLNGKKLNGGHVVSTADLAVMREQAAA